jgi:hypothetical protein
MKMNVPWFVARCSLVEFYRRFRGACCLHCRAVDSVIVHRFLVCSEDRVCSKLK